MPMHNAQRCDQPSRYNILSGRNSLPRRRNIEDLTRQARRFHWATDKWSYRRAFDRHSSNLDPRRIFFLMRFHFRLSPPTILIKIRNNSRSTIEPSSTRQTDILPSFLIARHAENAVMTQCYLEIFAPIDLIWFLTVHYVSRAYE